MQKLTITFKDYIHCVVRGLDVIDTSNVVKKFKIFVPTAKYTAIYKLGRWDGYVNYFNVNGSTFVNLIPEILKSIDEKKYDIEYIYNDDLPIDPDLGDDIDEKFMSNISWYKGHRLEGQPIMLEEHQVRCVNALCNNHRSILSASTSAGKTLITGALLHKIKSFGRSVVVVPGKDLCQQTADELKYFGHDVGIVGMGIRDFGHNVTVCTWQTINSMEKKKKIDAQLSFEELNKLTENVVCLIFDEVHTCKGTEVKKVAEQTFKNVPIRWGLTGTVPKDKSEYYNILTSLGPVCEEKVTAKELQEKSFLSGCQINCIRLKDSLKFMEWSDESVYLSENKNRIQFVANLMSGVVKQNNNTLILINHIKTGELLEEMMIKNGVDAIFLNGSTKSKKRFEEYEKIKTENNKCIIATVQIASTGLNIPRLFNVVLLDVGKSFTRVIQSIGRGLRKASDKDFVSIYDISSELKFSKRHFNERIKYYNEAQYPYKIFEIDESSWKI